MPPKKYLSYINGPAYKRQGCFLPTSYVTYILEELDDTVE